MGMEGDVHCLSLDLSRLFLQSSDRQPPNPETSLLEHDDASLRERNADSVEVGNQQSDLKIRSTLRDSPKQNDRRGGLAPQRESGSEVGISRDEDAPFLGRALEDLVIARGLQAVITNVDGVVSRLPQTSGHGRR